MGTSSQQGAAVDGAVVLETLGDEPTRAIIEELSEPMTANELSEACDIPLSTMYRKLDRLTEASLVAESTEIRRSGQHTTRYTRDFEEVTVWVSDEEQLATTIERPATDRTADRRLEELWGELRKET
ncbi:ArsR family transcriptional regulator [Halonotius terrestris]|uniref:ArsR family transcriptional regulator n=1 Tax=Halonotius terrestris TaxID=2487750 RepID=A0A8J8PBB5_9EURY|nr:helix-turn-helix domain-containing protein [Halonotius terrestris]TQQ79263.1 ArsR family transcriptional regulator [Halonotius terrestris]